MGTHTLEVINRLPKHLQQFVVQQNYDEYSPIDHAVWRYIMRVGVNFLKEHAHESYLKGLERTGIRIDRIPDIDEMNEILSAIGWGAVCVDGFIPPNAFMEFQAYQVLVIAADIRTLEHIEYTPAPDIVHEAAGHAPIIGDPEYAEYLRLFGEIGSKALSNPRDKDIYEAIRRLSILKENPQSRPEEIEEAEQMVLSVQEQMGTLSEMARIRNLHWWTVEYGLIGDISSPKIYGAGLLSSIGESMQCLEPKVEKLPYNLDTADFNFDITSMQPQLFVCKDFSELTEVLDQFADTMALRTGGISGIFKAIQSEEVATAELSSGIQISGKFANVLEDEDGEVAYLQLQGPSMLSEHNQVLLGHGTDYHLHGFGSPVGKVIGLEKPLEECRISDLQEKGICLMEKVEIVFESSVKVSGVLELVRKNADGKILLMTFTDCTVTRNESILFEPDWGNYDMAVGAEVTSVYAGAADKLAYHRASDVSANTTPRNMFPDVDRNALYRLIRKIRESNGDLSEFKEAIEKLENEFPDEWLIRLELLELLYQVDGFKEWKEQLLKELNLIAERHPEHKKLIFDGLNLIE
jgi:phenylalanine-4-hydroxylase